MTGAPRDVIGLVGLGNIGGAMARRLLAAGEEVHVVDTRPEAVARLVAEGAHAQPSVRALADAADVILVALPNARASRDVAAEAALGRRVRRYLETSTLGPEVIGELRGLLGSVALVDAPVSGGPSAIEEGRLTVYLAGSAEDLDRVTPWLSHLASTLLVVGEEPGLAQIAKLVNNAISLSSMVISCEAVTVGVAAGIPAQTVLDAVNAGTGRNSATTAKIPRAILTGRFDYGGPVGLAVKDLELYRAAAAAAGLHGELTVDSAVRAIRATVDRLGADVDYSEMIRIFEDATGVQVRATDA